MRRALRAGNPLLILPNADFQLPPFTLQGIGFFPQLLFQQPITLGVEYLPENNTPLIRASQQQLEEFALCKHCHLYKLFAVNADNLLNRCRHNFGIGLHIPIRQVQFSICFLRYLAGAP